jgi:hypothetical protein
MVRFAGILPYAFDSAGKAYVLLSQERFGRESGRWSGFAGGPMPCDEDCIATACRETFEESCGLLGTIDTLRSLLKSKSAVQADMPSGGTHFLLNMQLVRYLPHMFTGVQQLVASRLPPGYSPYLEKQALAWFCIDDLQHLCFEKRLEMRAGFLDDMPSLLDKIRALAPS